MSYRTLPWVFATVLAATASGCANYADQLARAEQHYQNARYEAALTNLEDLEIHKPALSPSERVRYDYVRGMAHLRLEQRSDARYWLSQAREESRNAPGVLTEDTRATVDRTITELDPLGPPAGATSEADSGTSTSSGGTGAPSGANP